jgi:hypothetical protein
MYWTIGSFPELDHLEPHERARLMRLVPWWIYAKIISRYALLGLIIGLPVSAIISMESGGAPVPIMLGMMIPVVIAGYIYELKRMRRSLRETIAEAFRGQTLPFCMNCGYDLRAAVGEECPECGAAVVAR